jgi:membrane-associated phospholipid phosphatase
VLPQIHVDEFLFGSVPSVDLQQRLYDAGALSAFDVAAWVVYLSHFFATVAIAAVLWRCARPRFLRFRAMILTVSAAAFVTYALFPAVPPWMAADDGVIGPVSRVIGDVWNGLGVQHAAAIWERGSTFSNPVAAIPSLHTAYPVLILCFFWGSGRWARIGCLAYALAMSVTLVYTGEHYVADVIAGWAYAIAAYAAVTRAYAWWEGRQRRRESEPPAPAHLPPPRW